MQHDHLISFSELSDSFEQNALRTEEKRQFAAKVNAAMARTEPAYVEKGQPFEYRSKEEKLEALDKIVAEGIDGLDSSQMMSLFSAYRDLAAFDKMISLYKSADNEDFKNAPMVREQLAVAYRKVPRGKDKEGQNNSEKLADKMWDYHQSMDICLGLIREGYGNGVTFENIGRCMRYISDKTEMSDKSFEAKRKNELLVDSLQQLEEGFMATLESSIGIQAVHGNIMTGQLDKAKETAKVVYLATLRDGAEESHDYFCLSAALQAACIAGESKEVVDHLYNRLESSIRYQWELDDISRDMNRIVKSMPSERSVDIAQRMENLKKLAVPRKNSKGEETDLIVFDHKLKEDRFLSEDEKLKAVRSYSYSYRGCGSAFRGTSRVGGNMAFGGQLPDHTVSRKDLRLFTGLVKMTPAELGIKFDKPVKGVDMTILLNQPLTKIKDPELFMLVADKFIRQTFTTENFAGTNLHMENNALDKRKFETAPDKVTEESVYDATVKSVLRACGKKIGEKDGNIDTRTNISAIFALGMGDCRHHAQVKQIMFDMWQKQQMNQTLSDMYYHVWQGKQVDTKGVKAQEFFDVLDTELRTADVQVKMPVRMNQEEKKDWAKDGSFSIEKDAQGNPIMVDKPYSPELVDGKFVVDTTKKLHNLEDHTLCWLIKKDRQGKLTEFGLRDAFYQDLHYDWGHKNVPVDEIEVTADGKPRIPAGKISGSKTTTGQEVPVYQDPTPYNSGKRDTVVTNSIGRDVCLVGVPLSGFATPKDFLAMIKDRDGMADVMQKILLNDPKNLGWTAWREEKPQEKKKSSFLQQGIAEKGQEIAAPKMDLQGKLTQQSNSANQNNATVNAAILNRKQKTGGNG